MRRSLLLVVALVAALGAGCGGEDGKDGAMGPAGRDGTNGQNGTNGQDGDDGDDGDDGQDAPWTGTLSITVQKDGAGVAGATITGIGTTAKTTNANGLWSGEVAIGAYVINITAPNLTPVNGQVVAVQAESTTAVIIPMVSDGSIPGAAPTFEMPAPMHNVGFGKNLDLSIANLVDTDTPAANLTISWAKTAGPAVTIANGNTATPTITLADIPTARTYNYHGVLETVDLPDTMGVVAMSPDTAGRYTFAVTVTDPEGHTVTKTVAVTSAAFNSTGTRAVAVDQPVFVRGVAGQATYAWTITGPSGSAVPVEGTGRFVSFTPGTAGKYTVTEGGRTLEIYASTFAGSQAADPADASCLGCHDAADPTDKVAPILAAYLETGHADMLHMVLTDPAEDHYASRCMACHVVGYDPTADNGGFDEAIVYTEGGVEKTWVPNPYGSQANWDNFMNTVGETARPLANIQCENCHGAWPLNPSAATGHRDMAARTTLNSSMCASCHASGAHHDRYYLWEESGHSNTQLALDEGGSASCARCHSAEGFIAWSDAANATGAFPGSAAATGTTTITCAACHDPHDATNPDQLRLYGDLPKLPNGLVAKDAGSAAICMACHNTRNAYNGLVRNDANSGAIQDDRDPHAPSQMDVIYGQSAYFMDGARPSAHLSIEDSCVTCHMKIAPAGMHVANTNHSFHADETVCASCHSEHVTGGALMAETEKMLVEVEGLLMTKGLAIITAGATVAPNTYAYRITPIDHGDDCTGNADQTLNVLPTSISHVTTSHGRNAFELEFATPVTLAFPACNGAPAGNRQMTHVVVQTSKFKPATGTALIFPNGHDLQKAFWNFLLIEEDKSLGVHNPSFAIEVLDNTIEKLKAL